jgi:hypothetical protein
VTRRNRSATATCPAFMAAAPIAGPRRAAPGPPRWNRSPPGMPVPARQIDSPIKLVDALCWRLVAALPADGSLRRHRGSVPSAVPGLQRRWWREALEPRWVLGRARGPPQRSLPEAPFSRPASNAARSSGSASTLWRRAFPTRRSLTWPRRAAATTSRCRGPHPICASPPRPPPTRRARGLRRIRMGCVAPDRPRSRPQAPRPTRLAAYTPGKIRQDSGSGVLVRAAGKSLAAQRLTAMNRPADQPSYARNHRLR